MTFKKINTYWREFKIKLLSDNGISSRRKIFNALWALFFGFVVIGIVFAFTNNNPFNVFWFIFKEGLGINGNKFITYFTSYILAALAISICFKAGIFNIGISGQMMCAGFTTLIIFRSELLTSKTLSGSFIFLAFFISIIIGIFFSLILGILKAYLGINEVVASIMLNWIIFYLIKFLINYYANWDGQDFLTNNISWSNSRSLGYTMPAFFQPSDSSLWYTNKWNFILLLLVGFFVFTIWFILSKTNFGYKIKMVGLNPDAADYSGTNKKSLILIIMTISGALSGIAGFVWYIGLGGQLDLSLQPLAAGFDALAISLFVFNNPIGILFSSFLYGIISSGSELLSYEYSSIPIEINQIILGIMVYSAAITFIFTKFQVFNWIKNQCILISNKSFFTRFCQHWKSKINHFFEFFVVKKEIYNVKNQNKIKWKEIIKNHLSKIMIVENEYNKKYQMKKFRIDKLSKIEQINYFEKLAELNREKDWELAENKYFDKNVIRSTWQEKAILEKNNYKAFKQEIIEKHLKRRKK